MEADFFRRLERLSLILRSGRVGAGRVRPFARHPGSSIEWDRYRPYADGDDPRRVDWNVYGRLDKLVVRLSPGEGDARIRLLLDASRSMGTGAPDKLSYAKQIAAAVAWVGLGSQDRIEIHATMSASPDGSGLASTGFLRGPSGRSRLRRFLKSLEASGSASLEEGANALIRLRPRGENLLVLLSDFLFPGGAASALKRLSRRHGALHVVHVLSRGEMEPAFEGPLRLADAESGAELELELTPALLRRYHAELARFIGDIRNQCRKYGASYTLAPSWTPLERLALGALRTAGLFA